MGIEFYKYHGAGNDFILIDNRQLKLELSKEQIKLFCDRNFGAGADGLMTLGNSDKYAFSMRYYNSDGGEASMCGNGGRCIVAFASRLKLVSKSISFGAIDGVHHATINSTKDNIYDISLQMIDVLDVKNIDGKYFLNTGVPHHIEFVDNVDNIKISDEGSKIRYSEKYKKFGGANVNFVEENDGFLKIRTYERGVEGETLACGTGATAAAIAYSIKNNIQNEEITLHAPGGELRLRFDNENKKYTNIILSGPAQFVYSAIWENKL